MADNTSRRDLEDGIERDFSRQMSYGDYLHLDTLLGAQHPLSDPPHHDELLFIIQHQTSELWLKLVLHELRSARGLLAADDLRARAQAPRPGQAHPAHADRAVVGAGDPDAVGVRAVPRRCSATSSGFQSAQYRAVEFLLGNKNADMVEVFAHDPAARASSTTLLHEPSLYDEFLRLPGARRATPYRPAAWTATGRSPTRPHGRW